jgi:hypothetical protein
MNKNKNSKYYVPSSIQKLVVFTVIPLFLIQLVLSVWQDVNQYINNSHVGGLYPFVYISEAVPILLFLVAYMLNPRHLKTIERIFESLFMLVAGLICFGLLNMITVYIPVLNGQNYIEDYAAIQIIVATSIVLVYGSVLYWLRANKQWK